MATEVKLPDLGEGIEGGDIVSVAVGPGDSITAEQTIAEIETDKAVLEVPCPVEGRVADVRVKPGDHISVGGVLITVEEGSAVSAEPPAAKAEAPAKPAPQAKSETQAEPEAQAEQTAENEPATPTRTPPVVETPAPASEPEVPIAAGPGTRRLARELGVDLSAVAAAYTGERVTEELVKQYVKQQMSGGAAAADGGVSTAAVELPDFSQWGPVERVRFSTLQRKTADHLLLGWHHAPHVTQFDQANITSLEALRKRYAASEQGKTIKLTVTAFVFKAVAMVLKEHPQFNASLDEQAGELVLKRYYHLGVAVDTEAGLIVPVLRDIDQKNVLQIAAEMNELAERTRQRKIALEELRGGTFTVTNLGGIGGTGFTPIINHPEVAILGVARSRREPAIVDGQLTEKLMMPLCLSYDHRVVNGADGARFIRRLTTLLEDPELLLLGA